MVQIFSYVGLKICRTWSGFFIVLPSGHPLGETLDMIFQIGDGTHKVSCSLLGFFLEVEPNRGTCDPWMGDDGG
jgi:hypothetical protein